MQSSSNLNNNVVLRAKQREAINLVSSGKNIFLTGAAGTGKSKVVEIIRRDIGALRNVAVTATTGVSALNIDGTTIHRYLGINLGNDTLEVLTDMILKSPYKARAWRRVDILIIDEISMLDPELFDKLETIARIVRKNDKPFGGIQLVLVGDFLQLPVVGTDKFCFEAESWNACIKDIVNLTEIVRQDNQEFQDLLGAVRINKLLPKHIATLRSRLHVQLENTFGIRPTVLYSTNASVDYINKKELDLLADQGEEFYRYELDLVFHKSVRDREATSARFLKNLQAPQELELCVGAQVMLLCNDYLENHRVANGSRGVIKEFMEDKPVVTFLNGAQIIIEYHEWSMKEDGIVTVKAFQIPLRAAYAATCHKLQSVTVDLVEIDLGNVFAYGQGYSALSRVRTLEGLRLLSFEPKKIKAHPRAIEYYNSLEKILFEEEGC